MCTRMPQYVPVCVFSCRSVSVCVCVWVCVNGLFTCDGICVQTSWRGMSLEMPWMQMWRRAIPGDPFQPFNNMRARISYIFLSTHFLHSFQPSIQGTLTVDTIDTTVDIHTHTHLLANTDYTCITKHTASNGRAAMVWEWVFFNFLSHLLSSSLACTWQSFLSCIFHTFSTFRSVIHHSLESIVRSEFLLFLPPPVRIKWGVFKRLARLL